MDKLYYTISEVSKMVDIPDYTLRNWEKEFSQLKPHTSSKGTRRYSATDINLVNTIKHYIYSCKLNYDGVRQRLNSKDYIADERKIKAIRKLRNIRAELVAIRREINTANEALASDIIID